MSDHFVQPDVAAFLTFLNAQPGPKMSEMSTEEARMSMVVLGSLAEADMGPLAVIRDLVDSRTSRKHSCPAI